MYTNSDTERYMLTIVQLKLLQVKRRKLIKLSIAAYVQRVSVSKEAMLSVQLPYFTQQKIQARRVYGKAMFAIKYTLSFAATAVP